MTEDRLAQIEALAAAATEGPWKRHDFGYPGSEEPDSIVVHSGDFNWDAVRGGEFVFMTGAWDSQEAADADFVASARVDVPWLVARVRELEAQLAEAQRDRDELEEFQNSIADRMPEDYDGDEAQEAHINRWLDDLAAARPEAHGA